ncbi:hypothetical protein RUESEDTHA_01489 [Ruegeria sp. THAF57]|uniref:hypothetical protein n=1 Tax=Ruegeria sp. THAF57 TaxID=2744555 RepID=UPI0015DE6C56|nr:hypothetical protein [Ruegeria sp. THAF57]CAD0184607.1 hypothetical protein RUESEDTHA_01489 [Ruegeria sp. THAF57]
MKNSAVLEQLENWIAVRPNDLQAIRRLVTLLDMSNSAQGVSGAFGRAQSKLASTLPKDWQQAFLAPSECAVAYKGWLNVLKSAGIKHAVPVAQVFSGQVLKVQGKVPYCDARLKFFSETKVIPALCHGCYKVQILPETLEKMIQAYLVLLKLDLPGNNTRKCMIELRDGIKYPYKGYIYCNSADEAKACLAAFEGKLAEFGVSGLHLKISHGCSEYGLEYPAFKYSVNAEQTEFEAPKDWAGIEEQYFKGTKFPKPQIKAHTKPFISLRDVFVFRTWAKYAQLIGDETATPFIAQGGPDLPAQFVKRVKAQAAQRNAELTELAAMSQGAAG